MSELCCYVFQCRANRLLNEVFLVYRSMLIFIEVAEDQIFKKSCLVLCTFCL